MNWKILGLLFLPLLTLAQTQYQPKNLVYNPSFEYYDATFFGKNNGFQSFEHDLAAWKAGNKNTPDLWVYKEKAHLKCQKYSQYCSKARTGENMVGIMSYMTNNYTDTYREYITVPLKSYLRPQVTTYIEIWVRKGDNSKLISNNLGCYFSRKAPKQDIMVNLPYPPQFNHTALINQDSQKWEKITGSFVPQQPYKYLTIGNFFDNRRTQVQVSPHHDLPAASQSFAYYLIDDVRVWQEGDSLEDVATAQPEKSKPIILKNIKFETSSAVLLESSGEELQQLLDYLKKYPNTQITIHGHTDNVGEEAANLLLSQARAQAVVDFLLEKGIAAQRLSTKGLGATQPLTSNATPEGRAQNRRVEFLVTW